MTKLQEKLTGEKSSEDRSESEDVNPTETRTVSETHTGTTNNVSEVPRDTDSQNGDNTQEYVLIVKSSAKKGTKELNIIRGLGTKKEVIEFKKKQDHLTKFRKTIDSRFIRYRKQIEDTDDADELKALQDLLDSEETKKLSSLIETAWFELENAAVEMVELTSCEEEEEEILSWVRDNQYDDVTKVTKDRVAVGKVLSEKLCKLNISETSEKDLGDRSDLVVPELSDNANLEEGDECW